MCETPELEGMSRGELPGVRESSGRVCRGAGGGGRGGDGSQRGWCAMLKSLSTLWNSFHREIIDKLVILSGDLKTLMSFICGI